METTVPDIIQHITFSVVKYLESKPGVCNVKLHEHTAVSKKVLESWEQKHCCLLPNDLRNCYLTTNGIKLSWAVNIDGSNPHPLGLLYLHPLHDVVEMKEKVERGSRRAVKREEGESDSESEDEVTGLKKPCFDSSHRIFELDPCRGVGKVCLVYRHWQLGCSSSPSEIWFLDRSLRWHFLVSSFTCYFRLMLLHLGLPQWQYVFTDIGLSMQAKQWFNMYAPSRLQTHIPGRGRNCTPELADSLRVAPNQLDVAKVFKTKNEKKKPAVTQSVNQNMKRRTMPNRSSGLSNPRPNPVNQNLQTAKGKVNI
ncbi:tubulin polyglutamylase complex subunit 2-like [Argonauta hians]